jgi:lysozyme
MNMEMAVQITAALCRRFEGLYLRPYLCPAGVPTIGYGATFYEDGRKVSMKDAPITKARAEALLLWHIKHGFLPPVMRLCAGADTPERLAALVDFAFNLGVGNLKASTLRKRVNQGDWLDAQIQVMKWNKAGGKVLRGLTIRRTAERDLLQ